MHWEFRILGEVRGYHEADGVGVDQADVEHEGDDMVLEDDWLQVEVCRYEGPCDEVREQAVKWFHRVLFLVSLYLHDVQGALNISLAII